MKKSVATILFLLFPAWMVLGSLVTLAVSAWVVDPGFYRAIATDQRIYEAAADELYPALAKEMNTGKDSPFAGKLDEAVLARALREALPPAVLAETGGRVVDEVFRALQDAQADGQIKLVAIKQELIKPRMAALIKSYAAALPEGPAIKGGSEALADWRNRPANLSPAAIERLMQGQFEASLAAMPDSIPVKPEQGPWNPVQVSDLSGPIRIGGFVSLVVGLGFVFALSLLAAPRWPLRAHWSGSVLLIPTLIVLVVGAVGYAFAAQGLAATGGAWLGQAAAETPQAWGTGLGPLGIELLANLTRTVSTGFLWTGLIALAVCVALISLRRLDRGGEEAFDDI